MKADERRAKKEFTSQAAGGPVADPNRVFHPFRAIRYDFGRENDLSNLVSPPYDIISERRQTELYERSEHNFVRIELVRAEGATRYEEAARTLRGWLNEGVLVREQAPAIYVLEQEFVAAGRSWRRRGVFGLVRLPERNQRYVLSHEGTLSEPKADRLNLMRACRAMISPIMMMAEDERGGLMRLLEVTADGPQAQARESDGVVDRLWVLSDAAATKSFSVAIGEGPLYIADGHHRFETALTYRDEMRDLFPNAPDHAGFNHALVLVNSAQDPGLRIFPTHRLITGLGEQARRILRECMEKYFEIQKKPVSQSGDTEVAWLNESTESERHVFGAYMGNGELLRLVARVNAAPDRSGVVGNLDVSILHGLLVDPALAVAGCGEPETGRVSHDADGARSNANGARLTYTTDAAQAIAMVDRGEFDVAFFLAPTRIEDVIAAARAGERMPGKSTYFYPKVPAGLVVSDASEEPAY